MRLRDVPILLFGMVVVGAAMLHLSAGLLELSGLWPQARPLAIGMGVAGGLAVVGFIVYLVRVGHKFSATPASLPDYSKVEVRHLLIYSPCWILFATVMLYGGDVFWKVPAKRDSLGESLASAVLMVVVVTALAMFERYRANLRR